MQRRNLDLKTNFESGSPHFSFKRLVPGGFNLGLIGSTCTALPMAPSASLSAQKRRNAMALRLTSGEQSLLVNAMRQFTQSVKVVESVSVM